MTYPKANEEILCDLFNIQCIYLYACGTSTQRGPAVSRFYTTWNVGGRKLLKLLKLPYNMDARFLTSFVNNPHVQYCYYVSKMMMIMSHSTNTSLEHMTRRMVQKLRSIIGTNWHIMCEMYGFNI